MDPQTASTALAITQLCISTIMIGVYFAAPAERYTRLWAMFGVVTPIGMTLILLGHAGATVWLLILGNVLLFSGCVLVWVGMRAFFGRSTGYSGHLLIALFALIYIRFIYSEASIASRALLSSVSLILIFSLCLQTLLVRDRTMGETRHAYARRTAIIGLLLMLSAHLLRIYLLWSSLGAPAPESATLPQTNALVTYLIPLAGTLLFFPALLLLYFERVREQLQLSLKAQQQALEQQSRFVDVFSHEYRTPLAVLRTNLDILQDKTTRADNTLSTNLEKMQRAIARLVEVAETAVLSDPREKGGIGPLLVPISMPDFLIPIIAEAREFWSERTPRIELFCQRPVTILGDEKQLKTALLNVLDNAIKYSPAASLVEMRLATHTGKLEISISDQGPGIPEPELELVYGKYFRGSRTSLIAGSGMGLYLVLRIIGQHAGKLGVANRPDGGTCVTLTLPLPTEER